MTAPNTVFSEENFKKVVENAPIGILIIDRDLKWRFVNQRFCEITGYTREELAGKTFLDITYKEDIENNLTLYHQLLDGKVNEYFYEKRYVRKNGQIIWVRLAVAAVRTDGEYSHMVVSVQDIDDSKRYQRVLELKNEELDTLFYKASHDLKSPVTTLSGLCHLLHVERPDLAGNDTFHHLEQTVSRLQAQNEALLEITRIHDWQPQMKATPLKELVSSAIMNVSTRGVDIKMTDLDVVIETDRELLSIAVKSIVENGIQYRRALVPPRVIIDFVRMSGRGKITVSDNGMGISGQKVDQIFNMFTRASENSHGSGMGLYIAKKAVEKLDGEILVASTEGEGSSFSIFLPAN